MEKNLNIAGLLKKAYDKLKASDAPAAYAILEEAMNVNFDNPEVIHALKCIHWWIEHTGRIENIENPFEKGIFLISLFKKYFVFLQNLDCIYDQCQYAIRCYVYSSALVCFHELLGTHSNQHDPGLLLLVGRCFKGLGNYDEALNYIEQALRFKREDAETLAEAADINALLAETKDAKALFREAFYIDPSKIDLNFLESELILKLKNKVAQLGYKENELCEWIPVYGYVFGVFSIKRELKQVEAGRLKQAIFSLEAEMETNPDKRDSIKPRLLNRYFWLIDYYENTKTDPSLIDECLLKIKMLDPGIYKIYTGEN